MAEAWIWAGIALCLSQSAMLSGLNLATLQAEPTASGNPGRGWFLAEALFGKAFDPVLLCHIPLIVRDSDVPLGRMLTRLTVEPEKLGDDVIDVDVMRVWTDSERRIITGSTSSTGCCVGLTERTPDRASWLCSALLEPNCGTGAKACPFRGHCG